MAIERQDIKTRSEYGSATESSSRRAFRVSNACALREISSNTHMSFSVANDRDKFWLDHVAKNVRPSNHADQFPILPYHRKANNAISSHLGDDSVEIFVFLDTDGFAHEFLRLGCL